MKVSSHPAQVTKKKDAKTLFRSEERSLLSAQVPSEIEYSFML